jgi:hypothetical protein
LCSIADACRFGETLSAINLLRIFRDQGYMRALKVALK